MTQDAPSPKRAPFLGGHWRAPLAGVAGAAAGLVASVAGLKVGASALVGWDVAAVTFLVALGAVILFDSEEDLRARAAREDAPPLVLTGMILTCIAFAFVAVVVALREGHAGGPGRAGGEGGGPILGLMSIGSLALSWLCLQALFTLHYAHRYFGDAGGDGAPDKGMQMNGDPPRTYRDFIYIAVCIGACFQVSDFGPVDTRTRNLVTAHALISFAFNALLVSMGVGIVGDLLKG